jgi:hypothetical protein
VGGGGVGPSHAAVAGPRARGPGRAAAQSRRRGRSLSATQPAEWKGHRPRTVRYWPISPWRGTLYMPLQTMHYSSFVAWLLWDDVLMWWRTGHASGIGSAGASQDVASADSQEFARRQRLLALLGWHAVPVPFGAVSAADSRGAGAPAEASSSPRPALQASSEVLWTHSMHRLPRLPSRSAV